MIKSFEKESKEIMEINNILYTIMPSDISLFSDNAIQEDVYFRSKGAFAFRSKKSKSKIILTFPIPLLDPSSVANHTEEEQELFNNGLQLMSQLKNYPFCFVRSNRIYSYLGVSFNTPGDYLMFGVEELKIVQDLRVPGVLFAEVTLLFNNHMNLVKEMSFRNNLQVTEYETVTSSENTAIAYKSDVFNNFMSSIAGDSLGSYTSLLQEIGIKESNNSFESANLLSNVLIKVPYIAGMDEMIVSDTKGNIVMDIRDEDLTKIDYKDFKMYDRFTAAENTFDGGLLQEFQGSIEDDMEFARSPSNFLYDWRAYYLKDRYIFDPEINSIQSITLSKKNIFASHHLGSSQHPYLQFMGKVPARLSISSVYNSKGSYEYNQKSTFNLFRLLLNSVDTINTLYPGANSVNYLKIKSVANNVLGIHNFIPGECVLSSTSDTGNIESFQTTFIENSMDMLTEESRVSVGRDVVNSDSMERTYLLLFQYAQDVYNTVKTNTKDGVNFPLHIEILRKISALQIRLEKERVGGELSTVVKGSGPVDAEGNPIKQKEEILVDIKTQKKNNGGSIKDGGTGYSKDETKTVSRGSSEYYRLLTLQNPTGIVEQKQLLINLLPMVNLVVSALATRETLNRYNKGEIKEHIASDIYFKTTYDGQPGKEQIKNISDVYAFDINVDQKMKEIYNLIILKTSVGQSSLRRKTKTQKQEDSIALANDTWLNNFVGDTQRDLGFEKYEPDVNLRKYLDPFFFLETSPYIKKIDFFEANQMLNGSAFNNLKAFINKEIGEEGILDGGSTHAHKLIADMAEMKEKRYAPVKEAGERAPMNKQEEMMGSTSGLDGTNVSFGDVKYKGIGSLPAHFESGNNAAAANKDNYGSAYGKYQFNSAKGGIEMFYASSPKYAAILKQYTPGTKAYNDKWVSLATNDPDFEKAQDKAAYDKWYAPALPTAKSNGFKVDNVGVQEAIFSASIQHGGVNTVLNNAGKTPGFANMSPQDQIKTLYAARRRYIQSLSSVSAAEKVGIGKRYDKELPAALAIAGAGRGGLAGIDAANQAPAAPAASKPSSISKENNLSSNQSNLSMSNKDIPKGTYKGNPPKGKVETLKVLHIIDTDTISVSNPKVNGGIPFNIRAAGFDAPEARKNNKGQNQYWAPESLAAMKTMVKVGNEIKVSYVGKDVYNRVVGYISTLDGKDLAGELIANGHVMRSSNNTKDIAAQNKAKKDGLGMWKNPDKVVPPKSFRSESGIPENPNYNSNGTPTKGSSKGKDVALVQTERENIKQTFNSQATNRFIPIKTSRNYQITSEYGWRYRKDKKADQFHKGLDIAGGGVDIVGTPVMASSSGTAYKVTQTDGKGNLTGAGKYVRLVLDADGFTCTYMHLNDWAKGITAGGVRVEKGTVLGYIGNTGGSFGAHLHYQVTFRDIALHPFKTAELDTIPKKQTFNPGAYIHPDAFKSASSYHRKGLIPGAKAEDLVLKILGSQALAVDAAVGRTYTPEEIKGYTILSPDVIDSSSVYDDRLKLTKHMDKMFSNFECGMNISFPIIKGYVTVGNEDDEFYFEGTTLRTANYFELPSIQEFHLSTNNDFNPLDVCTFSLMNPSSIRSIPEDFGLEGAAKNVQSIDTQYYTLFYGNAIKLKPGMKLHIKAGYSNNPNKLHTIFNGIIREISGKFDAKVNLVCDSYATELINNTLGFERPQDMSKRKNASTGLLIGYALLEPNINHFGAQLGRTRAWWAWTVGNIFPSWTKETAYDEAKFFDGKEDAIIAGKGRAGDFRDPENKALISPFNMGEFLWNAWNPSRANLSQRLYTNIYSDAIEAVHDKYKSDFWARYKELLSMDSEVFYSYWVFRSNSWSVIKEMEYRHPGTLAKPLWYEERQTMFFGTKEQLYVAKDLDPTFMFSAGEAARYTDLTKPFVEAYMQERPKRLEPATGFHLLSSKLNILDNNMGFTRDFSTKINVIYYEDKFEGNMVNSDSDTETIELDQGLKAFDIRDKTIALNGCHEKYMAWLYGIQELKKQAEMMYTGTITVTGKPDMRAGDYAYMEDADRGFSGIIKIRECEHHYSHTSGYITTITPGLFVECTQFLWDTFFMQLGMASKISLIKSDLTVNNSLTSNQLAQDYFEYLKIIQGVQKTTLSDKLFGVGGAGVVAAVIPFLVRNMLKSSTIFGIEPTSKLAKLAAEMTKGFGTYAADVARATLGSVNARGAAVMTEAKVRYYKFVATNGTIRNTLKNATKTDKALLKAYNAAKAALKVGAKLPLGVSKLLATRSVSTVIGSIYNVAKGLKVFIMSNPIGFIIGVVVELCIGFVLSKLKKLELTHNPLLLFPINYNGKPYVSGISGFTNSGVLETMIKNLKTTITELRKASVALDSVSEGSSRIAQTASAGTNTLASAEASVVSVAEKLSEFLGN